MFLNIRTKNTNNKFMVTKYRIYKYQLIKLQTTAKVFKQNMVKLFFMHCVKAKRKLMNTFINAYFFIKHQRYVAS